MGVRPHKLSHKLIEDKLTTNRPRYIPSPCIYNPNPSTTPTPPKTTTALLVPQTTTADNDGIHTIKPHSDANPLIFIDSNLPSTTTTTALDIDNFKHQLISLSDAAFYGFQSP
uniref:Uncharacterized protein n=1 Tax=Lactuca sativa TaxID=4236 RepID=A0A9R1WM78_LACSA|nr:hypothetical protein LSAT_V11C100033610 [Lactuca sativa]